MQNNNCFIAHILSEDNITSKGTVCLLKWAKNKTKQHTIFMYKAQIDMLFLDIVDGWMS